MHIRLVYKNAVVTAIATSKSSIPITTIKVHKETFTKMYKLLVVAAILGYASAAPGLAVAPAAISSHTTVVAHPTPVKAVPLIHAAPVVPVVKAAPVVPVVPVAKTVHPVVPVVKAVPVAVH